MDAFKDRMATSLASAKQRMEETTAAAKQRVEEKVAQSNLSEHVSKLKESASAGLQKVASDNSLGSMLSALPASFAKSGTGLEAVADNGSEQASSDGEPATEKERLVCDAASSSGSGSRLQSGLSALSGLGNNIGQTFGQLGAKVADGRAKVAGSLNDGLEKAKSAGHKGVGTVSAMGSSGVERLREAKGKCGEALDAASAVSGVNLGGSGGGAKEDEGLVRVCKCCPPLSFKQRCIGAFACLAIGALLSLGSLSSLAKLLLGNPLPFAFKYTLGNLLSLGATSFIVGPASQCRDMMAPSRKLASLMYFATLLGTLLSVFVLRSAMISLVFIVLQFVALTWYLLSYIPYGQTAAKSIAKRLLRRAGLLDKSKSSHATMPLPAA